VNRIVSLLPSATEIVYALGLGDRLVGVSHSCDYPREVRGKPVFTRPRFAPEGLSSGEIDAAVRDALRRFGSVYQVDAEGLAAAQPDLLLTQGICEVCAVPARDAEVVALRLASCPPTTSRACSTRSARSDARAGCRSAPRNAYARSSGAWRPCARE